MKRWFSTAPLVWKRLFTFLLYVCGLALYGVFLNWGNIPYHYMDWAEVNIPRLAFFQNALQANQIPLHSTDAAMLRCGCDRYFTTPDAITTPFLVFLKWLPVTTWVLADIWLLYSLGFWGLVRLRERFKLPLPLFALVFLLFFFNGHILSHLAVGHLTWGGYFLFPWLIYLADRFVRGDDSWAWTLKSALLFLGIYLQGSFHQFVWSLIFYGVLAVTFYRRFWVVFRTILAILLVSSFRILPAVLGLGHFATEFSGGYPGLFGVYHALTHWVSPNEAMPFLHLGSNLGYWEFDLYIGKSGFWLLVLAGLAWLALQIHERNPSRILVPIAVLTLLSLDGFYLVLRALPLPLFSGERITSRIISLPFVFYVVYSLSALGEWSRRIPRWGWAISAAAVPTALYQAFLAVNLLLAWKVTSSAAVFPSVATDLSSKLANNHSDPVYFSLLISGALLGLVTLAGLAWMAYRRPVNSDLTAIVH
jgi:hypothetical protein